MPRAQNQNLEKANIAQQRNNLQKQKTKADTLTVDVEVWIYPTGGKAAKKVPTMSGISYPEINAHIYKTQLLAWHQEFSMTDTTDHMVDEVLMEAEKNYVNCPSYSTGDTPDFSRFVVINAAMLTC